MFSFLQQCYLRFTKCTCAVRIVKVLSACPHPVLNDFRRYRFKFRNTEREIWVIPAQDLPEMNPGEQSSCGDCSWKVFVGLDER